MSGSSVAPDNRLGELSRPGAVLFRTFDYLCRQEAEPRSRSISELHLTRYFTTAETADGCVGAAMSYYETSDDSLVAAERVLGETLRRSPITVHDLRSTHHRLMIEVGLDRSQASLLLYAVVAAVVGAWSVPLLEFGEHSGFQVLPTVAMDWAAGVEAALVVGYGGMLPDCVTQTNIPWVHVSDLTYHERRQEIDGQLQKWRRAFPHKRITAGPKLVDPKELEPFDCIWMSGSTICNGTLEPFVNATRKDARLLMQGQSCAVYPRYLFDLGISLMLTSLKPPAVSRAARADRDGQALRPFLEGNLPWISIVPT